MRHVFASILLCLVVLHSGISFGQAKKKAPASKVPRGSGSVEWGPVANVDGERRFDVRDSAKKIDDLIEAGYRKNNITGNSTLADSLFCRRAYLEIAGRVPLLEEIGKFVQSKNPRRRELLIDELLGSHDYVSHTYNYWADILRLQDHPINNNQLAQPYHEWIKDSIRENKPYDDWVREMLTAEGRI